MSTDFSASDYNSTSRIVTMIKASNIFLVGIYDKQKQESITRSVQLPYFCATAFSPEGLFLDTPFPLKLLFSRSFLCRFAETRLLFRRPFWRWIRFLTARFLLFRRWERPTGSSYSRFSFTFCIKTRISHRNTVRDGNQKKILRMYPPYLFVTHISCRSYGLTV